MAQVEAQFQAEEQAQEKGVLLVCFLSYSVLCM